MSRLHNTFTAPSSVDPQLWPRLLSFLPDHLKVLMKSPIIETSWKKCTTSYPAALLNHTIRVFIYAQKLAKTEQSEWIQPGKIDLLFAACLYHDISACENHSSERFEVNGGDIAVTDLKSVGVAEADSKEVWVAIALHTSAGIAERISPLARLVRIAVLYDFMRPAVENMMPVGMRTEVEDKFPRLEVEKVLGDAVTKQGVEIPARAPANSWPGCLVAAYKHNPNYEGVNPAF